jgi:hypothetical protein
VLFFPYHGHYGGQLISGPVVLQILDRLAPLHPHIMGDAICARFGQKPLGRMVASIMMMICHKKLFINYSMDGRRSMRTHTTTNQKQAEMMMMMMMMMMND